MNKIGPIIFSERKKAGLTQKELADKLNVTDKTISKWETGVTLPDVEMLGKIAEVLSCDIKLFYASNNEVLPDPSKSKENITNKNNDNYHHKRSPNYSRQIIIGFIASVIVIIGSIFIFNKANDPNPISSSVAVLSSQNQDDLDLYRVFKLTAIMTYYPEGKTLDDYTDEGKYEISMYRLEAMTSLALANSVEEIDNIYANFVNNVNKVK